MHVDALFLEDSCIVERFIQSHNSSDVELCEVRQEGLWSKPVALVACRRREGQDLAGNDPVHVSNVQSVVILIELVVKLLEVVPALAHCKLESSKAVWQLQLKGAWLLACVHEGYRLFPTLGEGFPCLLCRELKADNQEACHEVHGVGLLRVVGTAVVEDLDALILLQDAVELYTVPVQLGQVQGPEVLVVPLVSQDRVDVKEEAIWHVLRRLLVAVPIQSIYSLSDEIELTFDDLY